MGGYGSGRQGGRPTAEASLRIDLAWMLRTGRAVEGRIVSGSLGWTCRGQPSGTVGYRALMHEPDEERLELSYTRGTGDRRAEVRQTIRLCHTQPHYGGKRWWMVCPYRSIRIGKLYLPSGGDRFASRQAWRLGYHSQRIGSRDKAFEALFRLQSRLGCPQGWEQPIRRPKGMWHRTNARLEQRYWELDEQCAFQMAAMMARLAAFGERIK